jgi:IS30 family transposase
MKRYTQINQEEIYGLKKAGFSQVDIAKKLSRDPSFISRELIRNKGRKGYRPKQAHNKYMERRSSNTRISDDVIKLIEEKLMEKWIMVETN